MDSQSEGKEVWHDWVGELFEPVFGATIEDLVSREVEPTQKPRVKHVSVHDPEAVRKVYEKVHMMTLLDEEMRKQQKEKKNRPAIKQTTKFKTQFEPAPVPESVLQPSQQTVDVDDSCIWDTNEISVLREAYKSLKEQSINAMVCYREITKRNTELEALTSQQKETIENQRQKLREAYKANKRLNINVESLTEEVKYLTAKVGAMEEVIREIKTDQSDMVKELHDNRVATDKERMEKGRIKMKLDNLRKEALAEKLAAEDKIRNQCRKAIHDLKEEVKQLQTELKEEKNKRQITEKGLKHLRTHFSNLSVQEIIPANVVHTDQVKFVQY